MEHSSYFHNLALNGLWLVPKIKSALKVQRFQDTEDIQKKNVTMALKAVPQLTHPMVQAVQDII
jgi:hypothetical protein